MSEETEIESLEAWLGKLKLDHLEDLIDQCNEAELNDIVELCTDTGPYMQEDVTTLTYVLKLTGVPETLLPTLYRAHYSALIRDWCESVKTEDLSDPQKVKDLIEDIGEIALTYHDLPMGTRDRMLSERSDILLPAALELGRIADPKGKETLKAYLNFVEIPPEEP